MSVNPSQRVAFRSLPQMIEAMALDVSSSSNLVSVEANGLNDGRTIKDGNIRKTEAPWHDGIYYFFQEQNETSPSSIRRTSDEPMLDDFYQDFVLNHTLTKAKPKEVSAKALNKAIDAFIGKGELTDKQRNTLGPTLINVFAELKPFVTDADTVALHQIGAIFSEIQKYALKKEGTNAVVVSVLTGAFLGMVCEILIEVKKNTKSAYHNALDPELVTRSFVDYFYYFATKLNLITKNNALNEMNARFKCEQLDPIWAASVKRGNWL